jgi:hypothetical protein
MVRIRQRILLERKSPSMLKPGKVYSIKGFPRSSR